MSEAVHEILRRIEQLSEEDRLVLDERLAEMVEADWKREVGSARRIAQERGIDHGAISRAVRELRTSRGLF